MSGWLLLAALLQGAWLGAAITFVVVVWTDPERPSCWQDAIDFYAEDLEPIMFFMAEHEQIRRSLAS